MRFDGIAPDSTDQSISVYMFADLVRDLLFLITI